MSFFLTVLITRPSLHMHAVAMHEPPQFLFPRRHCEVTLLWLRSVRGSLMSAVRNDVRGDCIQLSFRKANTVHRDVETRWCLFSTSKFPAKMSAPVEGLSTSENHFA